MGLCCRKRHAHSWNRSSRRRHSAFESTSSRILAFDPASKPVARARPHLRHGSRPRRAHGKFAILRDRSEKYNGGWFDTRADDRFWFAYGQLYGYYGIVTAARADFKDVIAQRGLTQLWSIGSGSMSPVIETNSRRENIVRAARHRQNVVVPATHSPEWRAIAALLTHSEMEPTT